MRRLAPFALLLAVACAGPRAAASLAPVSPRFTAAIGEVEDARAALAAGGRTAVAAHHEALLARGIGLLRARLPHDVARPDVPRYLEARVRFGDALTAWARAFEGGADDATLRRRLLAVEDALRAWSDAHLGLAPEKAV